MIAYDIIAHSLSSFQFPLLGVGVKMMDADLPMLIKGEKQVCLGIRNPVDSAPALCETSKKGFLQAVGGSCIQKLLFTC